MHMLLLEYLKMQMVKFETEEKMNNQSDIVS